MPVALERNQAQASQAAKAELAAWRARLSEPGFKVAGLLVIHAGHPARARQLAGHVAAHPHRPVDRGGAQYLEVEGMDDSVQVVRVR